MSIDFGLNEDMVQVNKSGIKWYKSMVLYAKTGQKEFVEMFVSIT